MGDVEMSITRLDDKLLLSTRNVRWKSPGAPKLMPRYIGPFNVVEKICKLAYRVELPPTVKMHSVFHASLLQPWRKNGSVQAAPPRFLVNRESVFTVDRILDERPMQRSGHRKSFKEVLFRWEGYDPEHDSWEPEANILDPQLMQDYWDYVALREQH